MNSKLRTSSKESQSSRVTKRGPFGSESAFSNRKRQKHQQVYILVIQIFVSNNNPESANRNPVNPVGYNQRFN